MSEFIKTNEIYGEVAKIINGIFTMCLSILNLNVHSFYKNFLS